MNASATAIDIAGHVRAGRLTAEQATRDALDRITHGDKNNAFRVVRAQKAIDEAKRLDAHHDLSSLPLAGVPVAIKDNVPVAGEVMTLGSAATPDSPQISDHEVVRRLRRAGAVVVGITRVPELCMWGATDTPEVTTTNPWNSLLTAGGSSGGSAAAVASGLVPLALGNDGMGSIRIPSANCGLFGIKPGNGVVPADFGGNGWYGMAENGPIATTVADAAAMLAILADEPALAQAGQNVSPQPVKFAVAHNFPLAVGKTQAHWDDAVAQCARLLAGLGHRVPHADLPYPANPAPLLLRWFGGAYADAQAVVADGGDRSKFQARTRPHLRLGKIVADRAMVTEKQVTKVDESLRKYLQDAGDCHLVMTPALARSPIQARRWSQSSWAQNMYANITYAPFAGLFNLVRWPAMVVPFGVHPVTKTPLAVQFAGPAGSEELLLSVAAQIEQQHPWQRVAPGC